MKCGLIHVLLDRLNIHFFLALDDLQCTTCPDRQWSSIRSNSCIAPSFDVLEWGAPVSLYLIVAGVILLICQGSVFVLFLMHRGTPVVLASGGALTFATLLSLMGACLSLLLFFGQPGDVVCHIQLPLISIFQTVALSVILAVSLQVRRKNVQKTVPANYCCSKKKKQ